MIVSMMLHQIGRSFVFRQDLVGGLLAAFRRELTPKQKKADLPA
jgi:hypothetical protein